MKWPVVITVGGHDAVRGGFALSVCASWLRHEQADVIVLDGGVSTAFGKAWAAWGLRPPDLMLIREDLTDVVQGATVARPDLQRTRHQHAVRIGTDRGARYVWAADDDCLPRPEMDLDVAAALMDAHPEVWLAAVALPSCPLPHGADGAHTGPMVETGAVGGLRILRVDAFRDFAWPDLDPRMHGRYDATFCEAIRKAGGRVGFFGDGAPKHLRAQHLGEFVSTFEWPYPIARTYPRRWDE